MNFFAMLTLKNVRSCLRLPISMMPRFSLKLTLARLRMGMDSVGSLLRSAAVITASATLMSFFSTAPIFFAFACAMGRYLFLRFGALVLGFAALVGRARRGGRAERVGLALPLAFRRAAAGLVLSGRASSGGATALPSSPGNTGASPSGPSAVTMIEWGR